MIEKTTVRPAKPTSPPDCGGIPLPPPGPTSSRDQRCRLRIEASAGEFPKGTRLIPTGLGTFHVQVLDLSEAEAAKVIRAVKDALDR